MIDLDQYYTTPKFAKECWDSFSDKINTLYPKQEDRDNLIYLEPSAGTGVFYDLLPEGRRIGLDLEPKHPEVKQQDFTEYFSPHKRENLVVVGNPPFGYGGALSTKFINIGLEIANTVCFVLPIGYLNYTYQKHIVQEANLVLNDEYQGVDFTFEGKPHPVNVVVQVWTRYWTNNNMREVGKRYSNHPDFKTELVTPTLVKEYVPDTPTNSLFDTGVHYPTLRSRIVAEYQYGLKCRVTEQQMENNIEESMLFPIEQAFDMWGDRAHFIPINPKSAEVANMLISIPWEREMPPVKGIRPYHLRTNADIVDIYMRYKSIASF